MNAEFCSLEAKRVEFKRKDWFPKPKISTDKYEENFLIKILASRSWMFCTTFVTIVYVRGLIRYKRDF